MDLDLTTPDTAELVDTIMSIMPKRGAMERWRLLDALLDLYNERTLLEDRMVVEWVMYRLPGAHRTVVTRSEMKAILKGLQS